MDKYEELYGKIKDPNLDEENRIVGEAKEDLKKARTALKRADEVLVLKKKSAERTILKYRMLRGNMESLYSISDSRNKLNCMGSESQAISYFWYKKITPRTDIERKLYKLYIQNKRRQHKGIGDLQDNQNFEAHLGQFSRLLYSRRMDEGMYKMIMNSSLDDLMKEGEEGNFSFRIALMEKGMDYDNEVVRKGKTWVSLRREVSIKPYVFQEVNPWR